MGFSDGGDQIMPGPDGVPVKCYRRRAANILPGDYLPEHGAHVVTEPLTDPDDGAYWVALDDGREIRFTARGKAWLFRTYAAPAWLLEARDAWRAAYDDGWHVRSLANLRRRRCPALPIAASRVISSSGTDYRRAFPAPRLADFVRETCDARRES